MGDVFASKAEDEAGDRRITDFAETAEIDSFSSDTMDLSMDRGAARTGRNPFRVVDIRRLHPRVASQARQPWALRRNPFGILGLRRRGRWSFFIL